MTTAGSSRAQIDFQPIRVADCRRHDDIMHNAQPFIIIISSTGSMPGAIIYALLHWLSPDSCAPRSGLGRLRSLSETRLAHFEDEFP